MDIDEIYDHSCNLCPLGSIPTNKSVCVPGRGIIQSRAVIVGEAPGATEDEEGLPFVGQSGEVLDRALVKAGFDDLFPVITNAVKCRPVKNATPNFEEVDACWGYLQKEVELVNPVAMMTLGNIAMYAITGKKSGITRLAGIWQKVSHTDGFYLVLPNYHPAFVKRFPEKENFFQEIVKDFYDVWNYGLDHTPEDTWKYASPLA